MEIEGGRCGGIPRKGVGVESSFEARGIHNEPEAKLRETRDEREFQSDFPPQGLQPVKTGIGPGRVSVSDLPENTY